MWVGFGVRVGIGVMQLSYRGGRGTQGGMGGKGPSRSGLSFSVTHLVRSRLGQHGPKVPFGQRTLASVASDPSFVAAYCTTYGVPVTQKSCSASPGRSNVLGEVGQALVRNPNQRRVLGPEVIARLFAVPRVVPARGDESSL